MVKILCNDLTDKALDQVHNVENHPRRIGNVIVLPDSHSGYGMPIGCAVWLRKAISPNMVGADIGCGVMSVQTNLFAHDLDTKLIKEIMSKIRERVPVGFEWRREPIVADEELKFFNTTNFCRTLYNEAKLQAGTLGGGNHFIEIQKDEYNRIWFMIHCGSRNLGKKTGDFYNELAKEQCLAREEKNVIKQELAYLVEGTEAFKNYYVDQWACVKFAELNRNLIANEINQAFKEVIPSYLEVDRYDCRHNYAEQKAIDFVGSCYLHRKGAVSIEGKTVLIAGSQGTASYMVEAKEEAKDTYWTVSHGAGRTMGRMEAVRTLDLEKEKKILDDQGIIHSIRTQEDLDEATSSYKNIESVIKQEEHLLRIVHTFKPIAVIKG